MAETRTYDPSEGDDLAKLVRDAMGENVRPTTPGSRVERAENEAAERVADEDDEAPSLVDLPDFTF